MPYDLDYVSLRSVINFMTNQGTFLNNSLFTHQPEKNFTAETCCVITMQQTCINTLKYRLLML